MAIDNSSSRASRIPHEDTPSEEVPEQVEPLFKDYAPFSEELDEILIPGSAVRAFATSVSGIAGGCHVVAELLMQESSDDSIRWTHRESAQLPLLGQFHRGQLYALLSACMVSLVREAEQLAAWAYENRTKAGIDELGDRLARLRSGGIAH